MSTVTSKSGRGDGETAVIKVRSDGCEAVFLQRGAGRVIRETGFGEMVRWLCVALGDCSRTPQ